MKSIDEAIAHCLEVAEEKERQVKEGAWEKDSNTEKQCTECASEHRQLAEWLRELKSLREERRNVYMNGYNEGYEDAKELYS